MRRGSAGFTEPLLGSGGGIDDRIRRSWTNLLVRELGWPVADAVRRAQDDLERGSARRMADALTHHGWELEGSAILDIGSGHGSLAIELALSGAKVTALEPCEAWRVLSEERAARLGVAIRHVSDDARKMSFPSGTFDACVCLQVLEHVRNPKALIGEIARVLKPGGKFFVSCENYLAFREQEYGVWWLPALPKPLGVVYLQLLGRDPAFFRRHVHATYWPLLAKWFIDAGLIDRSWAPILKEEVLENGTRSPTRFLYQQVKRLFGPSWARAAAVSAVNRWQLFRVGFMAEGFKRDADNGVRD